MATNTKEKKIQIFRDIWKNYTRRGRQNWTPDGVD